MLQTYTLASTYVATRRLLSRGQEFHWITIARRNRHTNKSDHLYRHWSLLTSRRRENQFGGFLFCSKCFLSNWKILSLSARSSRSKWSSNFSTDDNRRSDASTVATNSSCWTWTPGTFFMRISRILISWSEKVPDESKSLSIIALTTVCVKSALTRP